MRAIGSFIKAILLFAIALVGALFALHNKQHIRVDFIYFQGPEISLGLWLIVFLMFGALLGILFSSLVVAGRRRQFGRFKQRDESPMTSSEPRIIVALDFDNAASALALADQLNPNQCRLKVGKELFVAAGPQLVKSLTDRGFDIFLDLKFHDIPNTVAKATLAAADLGVWMSNVHASGGVRMMTAAKQAIEQHGGDMLLIAVTVLTSMDDSDLRQVGVDTAAGAQVMALAELTKHSGLDGVVCSAQEASALKQQLGHDFKLVTPGIRLTESASDDQRRIVSPPQAIELGSDYLVIGRPITQAEDPMQMLLKINQSLELKH